MAQIIIIILLIIYIENPNHRRMAVFYNIKKTVPAALDRRSSGENNNNIPSRCADRICNNNNNDVMNLCAYNIILYIHKYTIYEYNRGLYLRAYYNIARQRRWRCYTRIIKPSRSYLERSPVLPKIVIYI